MTETEAFLADIVPRQRAAERAIHEGDPGPRAAMWTREDPVTLFGAKLTAIGWDEVEPVFSEVASWFTGPVEHEWEIVAAGASGDLGYTVGYEHNLVSVDGQPTSDYTLRVTHVYRREAGEWKVVHRHGDVVPVSPPEGRLDRA